MPDLVSQTQKRLSRRNFLRISLGVLGGLGLVEMGGVGLLYLKPRRLEGSYGGVIMAGKVNSFPAGSVTEYPEGHFYLVRTDDEGFLAIYQRCPHLGCTVNWEQHKEQFFCPCHASTFGPLGNHRDSPVPRALDIFEVRIEGKEVHVDTSRLIRREEFSREQLVYAG